MDSSNSETLDIQQPIIRVVDQLLLERQQMLAIFYKVADVDAEMQADARRRLLQRFCEILVDYSALWHFEIFEYLKRNRGEYQNAMSIAATCENVIVRASESAVAFNDKYDPTVHALSFDQLDHDLSVLGEDIAARIDAEDQILSAMVVD